MDKGRDKMSDIRSASFVAHGALHRAIDPITTAVALSAGLDGDIEYS